MTLDHVLIKLGVQKNSFGLFRSFIAGLLQKKMISCIISVFKASVIKTVLLRRRKKIGTVALAALCTSLLSTWAHKKNHKSKIMGRASKFSPFEQGCMVELHRQGRSCGDIAAELGRSKTAVNNFLRCPEAYGTKKSTGRPKKLSQRAKNAILRSAWWSSGLSARQIAAKNGLDVSKDTISRCLKAESIRRRKRLCRPHLIERHKVWEQDLAPLVFPPKAVPGKLQAPHLVTFQKVGSAQALSSTDALGLEASGDGVLADIEAIFGSNLSGGKARASSGGSQDVILCSLGEFLWSACWLLCPVSFRAPQEVIHGGLAAAKLGCNVSAWPALSMKLNNTALLKWRKFWRSSHNFWFVVFLCAQVLSSDVHKAASATVPFFLHRHKRTVLIAEALKPLIIQLIIFFLQQTCHKWSKKTIRIFLYS